MENLEPAVTESTEGLIVSAPGGPLGAVESARPCRATQRTERPPDDRLSQEAVAGEARADEARAARRTGNGSGPGIALQCGVSREPLATVTDLAEHPGGEPRFKAWQAEQDLAVRVGFVSFQQRTQAHLPGFS